MNDNPRKVHRVIEVMQKVYTDLLIDPAHREFMRARQEDVKEVSGAGNYRCRPPNWCLSDYQVRETRFSMVDADCSSSRNQAGLWCNLSQRRKLSALSIYAYGAPQSAEPKIHLWTFGLRLLYARFLL